MSLPAPLNAIPVGTSLRWVRIVIQGHAHGAAVVSVILPYDGGSAELPQAGVVVGTDGHEVRRVCAERAIPDPALVIVEYDITR